MRASAAGQAKDLLLFFLLVILSTGWHISAQAGFTTRCAALLSSSPDGARPAEGKRKECPARAVHFSPWRIPVKKNPCLVLAISAALCAPAFAALQTGDVAPNFSAPASLAGKQFHFSLRAALKKGPVVVYFYPSAFTGGCDLEAHTVAEDKADFVAAGATIIGVSADSIQRLDKFSADPSYCAGKFPVASDPDGKIAADYQVNITPGKTGQKDVRGVDIDHNFFARETFVIDKNGKIVATFSSRQDHLTPDQHVKKALAVVQQLAGK